MADTKTRFGIVTVPATGTTPLTNGVPSGYADFVGLTLKAHPSNGAILYVRNQADTSVGFPLEAGATLDIDRGSLVDFVASGSSGNRLAFAYQQS